MTKDNSNKTAIIIGAGPAGLTAAYELLTRTDIKPIILEMTSDTGGISKTVNYKDNRIDIGGHRFFSKSNRVMDWWHARMPTQQKESDTVSEDLIMMIRRRISRIYFLRKFFEYPVSLNLDTVLNLGFIRIFKIMMSYLRIQIFPVKKINNLEDFFISRFGKELYLTFFKDYTEKVWGVACRNIRPEWGAQRIKGLSITKTIIHAITSLFPKSGDIRQKKVETSLIEKFLYPKFGPGQMWEEVARLIKEKGGEIHYLRNVNSIEHDGKNILSVTALHEGKTEKYDADYVFSTMPVKELIESMEKGSGQIPESIQRIAGGLLYRDFMTAGLLLNKLKIKNKTKIKTKNDIVPDNWIYIQERDVKIGRLQIFNNWSPYMVKNPDHAWIGLEYFCNEGDSIWSMQDESFASFAIDELAKIDIINKEDVIDHVVIRMPKAYPAYFGTYTEFSEIQDYISGYENLFLVGRNGMHKYNNSDHSMLTSMIAVDNIVNGIKTKDNIWSVNTEDDYHEEK